MKAEKRNKMPLKNLWQVAVLLFFLLSVIYSNSLDNSFHYDDFHSIVENYFLRDAGSIPDFFKSRKYFSSVKDFSGSYRPVLLTSYAINYHFGKLDPSGYHLVNLVIHFLVSLMVFLISARFFKNRATAFWACLIFAVTPFNSEVVNYINTRSSSLCTLFFLFAFYCYILFRDAERLKKILYYMLFMLFFALSITVKIQAVVLPAVIVFYDLLFTCRKADKKQLLLPYVPIFSGALLFFIRFPGALPFDTLFGGAKDAVDSPIFTSIVMLGEYIRLFFYPVNLVMDRNVAAADSISGIVMPVISILLLTVFIFKKRADRVILFWGGWFFITLSPILLMPFGLKTSLFQDSRGYLSVIALSVFAGMFVAGLIASDSKLSVIAGRKNMTFFVSVILIVLALFTYRRNRVWKSELTLWSDVAAKDKKSYMAQHSLGVVYEKMGEDEIAMEKYKNAVKIYPAYYPSYFNISQIYFKKKDLDNAMRFNDIALKIKPDYGKALYNKGYMFMAMGNHEQAIKFIALSLKENPNNVAGYTALGFLYQQQNDLDKSAENYEHVLRYDKESYETFNNLGLVKLKKGDKKSAEKYFMTALKLKPDFYMARMNLATLYKNSNEPERAVIEYQKITSRDKTFPEAFFFSGIILFQAGRFAEAEQAFKGSIASAKAKNRARYQWIINDAQKGLAYIGSLEKPARSGSK